MFDRLLDQKVNKDERNDTVDRVDFDNELEKFAVYIEELSEKFNDDQVREKANKLDESILTGPNGLKFSCLIEFGGPISPNVAIGSFDGKNYMNGTHAVITVPVRNDPETAKLAIK